MNRAICGVLFVFAILMFSAAAQAPEADSQALLGLLRDVQTQQQQIAVNQDVIEQKLGTLAETIRYARIYSSRGGR
jgi:hypothetical protein